MSKKRKAGGKRVAAAASASTTGHAQEGGKAETIVESRVREGAFCLKSSRGVPFLVVSDRDLVAGLPRPSPEEFQELLALCGSIAKQWEVRGAVVLSDFEGELMGIEGELVSAAFQRSLVLDAKGLNPLPSGGASRDTGLLLDLRCPPCIALTKRIMESDALCKAIWGADGDVASLRYTPVSKPLGIESANVLDIQLAYSEAGRRLSMANMLKRLPPSCITGLPDKAEAGGLDFAAAHGRNNRALSLPLPRPAAVYAVDDLHRVEAVLQAGKPSGGNYLQARSRSSAIVSAILRSPASLTNEKMRIHGHQLRKALDEKQRLSVAVRIKRHLHALRRIDFGDAATDAALGNHADLEVEADKALVRAKVVVPEDLTFYSAQAEQCNKEQNQPTTATPVVEEKADQLANKATGGKRRKKAVMKATSVNATAGAVAAAATSTTVAASGKVAAGTVGTDPVPASDEPDAGAPAVKLQRARRAKRRRGEPVAEDAPVAGDKVKRRRKAK